MLKADPVYTGDKLELEKALPSWDENALLNVDRQKLNNISLPSEDFCHSKYDIKGGAQVKQVLLLISTPRSGSTALCDHLYRDSGIIAHEYFQPFQYMPTLAERWSAIEENRIDPKRYADALVVNRTSKSGVLGINLHGSHINIFKYFQRYLAQDIPVHALYLKRQDKVAQAVSYYLAAKTRKWSSHFDSTSRTPKYSFSGIKAKLTSILNQEKRAELFLSDNSIMSQTIYYEALSSGEGEVPDFLKEVVRSESLGIASSQTRKQAGLLNTVFSERFVRDLLIRSEEGQAQSVRCMNGEV